MHAETKLRALRARFERPLTGRAPTLRLLLGLACCVLLSGCDRYAEITEGLSVAQREQFVRGKRQAGPCWVCHDITGMSVKVGPHLVGLFGREVGSLPNFSYSEPFVQSKALWNRSRLDRFIANPQAYNPATRMISPGISNPQQRADLLFFLEHVTKAD